MEYNGHKLTIERWFYEGELEETYFEVENPDGTSSHIDWSGRGAEPTVEDFALWIELNKPDRHDEALEIRRKLLNSNVYSPLNTNDLLYIKQMRTNGVPF